MKNKALLVLCFALGFSFDVMGANEPVAGAIMRKDRAMTPQADFNPDNLTNAVPVIDVKKGNQEIYFSADEMETNEKEAVIMATGKVEVIRGNLILNCDKLWYDQKKDQIVAQGNVVLKQEDGSVLYTDEITLSVSSSRIILFGATTNNDKFSVVVSAPVV